MSDHKPVVIENKYARWRYQIRETVEAGIVLSGQEVKSLKTGHGDLRQAYVTVRAVGALGKRRHRLVATLLNMFIPPYSKAGPLPGYNPRQPRRLLFHRDELAKLIGQLETPGLTMVPLRVYTSHRRLKV